MTALLDARESVARRWDDLAAVRSRLPVRMAGWALQAVLFVAFVQTVFDPPSGTYFNGLCNGAIYGIIGVGIVLVYRTHRIVNFAAAGLGAVPGIGFALLVALHGFSWWLALPLTIAGGAVLGGLVDILVIRRFARAPRLIVTVATIGVTQILAYAGFEIGAHLGAQGNAAELLTPFSDHFFRLGVVRFSYDYLFTLAVVAVAVLALAVFLRYTRIGIAMRASAENADRAALLGIPVKLVQTTSWVLAGMLASVTIFLRSALVGVPSDGSLGPKVLLFALAAAVLARMDSIPRCLVAGVGIGILGNAILHHQGRDNLTLAYLLVVLLAVLLFQRGKLSRAEDLEASSWQAVREFRPVPAELRRVREVVVARGVLGVVVAAVAVATPFVVDPATVGLLNLIVISAIVAVSLVILTGWAGQISLGQYGIVGVGAALAGKLASAHNTDFFLVMLLAMVAGALAAVLIGLPALRIRGLFLAVTTLTFAGAMESFFLYPGFRVSELVLPAAGRDIDLPTLWGRIPLSDQLGLANRNYYFVCLAFLGLALLMARAYRRNRAGRAVLAVRENSRAAASYSVNSAWTKLGAFAVSGAIAAMAGVLFAYQSRAIDYTTYGIDRSLGIFVVTVIGGLTSLPGAVFGAVVLESVRHFGGRGWSLLVTGPGLLAVLLVLPGGFAEAFFRLRDRFLRLVATRRGILVPSLVADRRVAAEPADESLIIEAEHHVESVDAFDAVGETVWCPVCEATMAAEEAPLHEHLRPGAAASARRSS